MPAEILDKEAIEFITRFSGATASVGEQMLFDWYWQTHPEVHDKFPYTRPHENLPMYDNFIVAGLNVAPWVISLLVEDDAAKKGDMKTKELAKTVREFSEGGIFYTVPRLARITAVHATAPAAPVGGRSPPEQRTETRGRVIKL